MSRRRLDVHIHTEEIRGVVAVLECGIERRGDVDVAIYGWGLHHYAWNVSQGRTSDWFAGKGDGLKFDAGEYYELLREGDVLFTVGESTIEARAGDIVVVPAGAPHKFVSRAPTHRQISIHPVAQMETEWLE